jgi:integrase
MAAHGVSPENQRAALVRLGTALELATRRGHTARNVARYVEHPEPPKPRHVQPSETDLQRLLRAVDGDRFEILAWLGIGAGLRRQELTALRWEDVEHVSADHAVLVVQRRVNYLGKGINRLEREGTKNGDPFRRVHIRGVAFEALQRRWKHQLADRLAAGKLWRGEDYHADRPSGYLLTNPTNGLPMNVRSVDKHFAAIRDRAGLDQRRLHGLRRVFTTLLDAAGVSERVTMKAAGHKTPAMTCYYQDPMESQLAEAAERLDRQLRRVLSGG